MKTNMNNNLYECSHYKQEYEIYTKCCKKWYKCKSCHNKKNTHILDISKISRIKCLYCFKKQDPKQYCNNIECGKYLGIYYCKKCMIFNNNYIENKIFHCNKCNRCLNSNSEITTHCNICNCCYENNLPHICSDNKLNNNCGICIENIIKPLEKLTILKCGHIIHKFCMDDYVNHSIFVSKKKKIFCPICRDNILNIQNYSDYNSDMETNIYNNNALYHNLLRSVPIRHNYIRLDGSNNENTVSDELHSNIDIIAQEIYNARIEILIANDIETILTNNILNLNNS